MNLLGFQSGPGSFMWHTILAKSDTAMSSQLGTLRFKVAKAGYGSSDVGTWSPGSAHPRRGTEG